MLKLGIKITMDEEQAMESRAIIVRDKMSIFFTLSMLMLILTGCEDSALAIAALPGESRTVATTYKVKPDTDTTTVECYRINTEGRSPMTNLPKNQLVEIVSVEDGLRRFDGKLWLRVYPPLSHRPNCYVNIDNLIPYS